ncbi:MAG: hypothetical protein KDA96_14605 [Planctomycetaceae bacterium]|nr:hypothetical protein [Planctomycetaceae bacterium]MCA9064297.1 hypothetical protein [Planctomycetaceae bacterium]
MRYLGVLLVAALAFFSFRYQEIRSEAIRRQLESGRVAERLATAAPRSSDGPLHISVEEERRQTTELPAPAAVKDGSSTSSRAEPGDGAVPLPPTESQRLSISSAESPSSAVETSEVRGGERSAGQTGLAVSQQRRSIRQAGPVHAQMLMPANFEYLGAFRPPHTDAAGHRFSYGGCGLAYRPGNEADVDTGSLYLVGHQLEQRVAEISIPTPVISSRKSMDDLPVARVLQDLGDITAGLLTALTDDPSQPFELGGLQVVDDRLHWTMYRYYNVDGLDFYSHATSSLNIADPQVEGPWHLGPQDSGRPEWHAHKYAGYIFDVPEREAEQWLGGRRLISGLQVSTGLATSSNGPAMISYRLPDRGSPSGIINDALPLMWHDLSRPAAGFHPADRWTGAAWLTLGDKQSVIVVGRKALGEVYYGDARPTDCLPDKGYHGDRYEAQVQFYSPASLIHAAHGKLEAFQVEPWYVWDNQNPGGGIGQYLFPTCHQLIGGITVDHKRNQIYISQVLAGATTDQEFEYLPVIHVFRISEPSVAETTVAP